MSIKKSPSLRIDIAPFVDLMTTTLVLSVLDPTVTDNNFSSFEDSRDVCYGTSKNIMDYHVLHIPIGDRYQSGRLESWHRRPSYDSEVSWIVYLMLWMVKDFHVSSRLPAGIRLRLARGLCCGMDIEYEDV